MDAESIITEKTTLMDIILSAGPFSVISILLAVSLFVIGLILYVTVKSKRPVGLWIMEICTKFSLISAGFCFFQGLVHVSVCCGCWHSIRADLLVEILGEACIGPQFLMGIALISFSALSLFHVKEKSSNQ